MDFAVLTREEVEPYALAFAAIGLEDLIIVDTDDALLVCPRSRAQDVKAVVEALRRAGKTQYL